MKLAKRLVYPLAVVGLFMLRIVAVAQGTIDLPLVTFHEGPVKQFELNQSLRLQIDSTIPAKQLQVRVFAGRKKELIAKVKDAPKGTCVRYSARVFGYKTGNGETEFEWTLSQQDLRGDSVNGFGNAVYTVVLEKAGAAYVGDFRLYRKDVERYFQAGQEIVLIAPEPLREGTRARKSVWARVAGIVGSPVSGGGTGGNSFWGGGGGSSFSGTAPASGSTPQVRVGPPETCLVIRTKQGPLSASSSAELVLTTCHAGVS